MPPTPEFKVIPSLVETIDRRGQNFQAGLGNARVSDIASITDGLQQGLKFGAEFQAKVLETKRLNDPETIFLDKVKKDLENRRAAELLRQDKIDADVAELFGVRDAEAKVRFNEKIADLKEKYGDREIESLINARNAQASIAGFNALTSRLNALKRAEGDPNDELLTPPGSEFEPAPNTSGIPAPVQTRPETGSDSRLEQLRKEQLKKTLENMSSSEEAQASEQIAQLEADNTALTAKTVAFNKNIQTQQRGRELTGLSQDYLAQVPQAVLDDNPAAGLELLGSMNSAFKRAKTPEAKQVISSNIQDAIEELGGADALDAFIAQNAQSPDEQQLLGQIVRQAVANTGDINAMPQDMQNLVTAGLPVDKAVNPSATYDDAANGLTSLEDIQDDDVRNTLAYDPYYAALTTATKNGTQGATMSTEIVDVPQDIGGEGPAKSAVVRFKGSSGEPTVDMPPPASPKDKATINILKRVIERQAGRFQSNQGAQQAAHGIQQRRQTQAQQFAQPLPEQGGRAVVTPQGDIPITDAQAGAPAQQVPVQQQQQVQIPEVPLFDDLRKRKDVVGFKDIGTNRSNTRIFEIQYEDGTVEKRLENGRKIITRNGVSLVSPALDDGEQFFAVRADFVNAAQKAGQRLTREEATDLTNKRIDTHKKEVTAENKIANEEFAADKKTSLLINRLTQLLPTIIQAEKETGEKLIGRGGAINRAVLSAKAFTNLIGEGGDRQLEFIDELKRSGLENLLAIIEKAGSIKVADTEPEKRDLLQSTIGPGAEVRSIKNFIEISSQVVESNANERSLRQILQGDPRIGVNDRSRVVEEYIRSGASVPRIAGRDPETGSFTFKKNPDFRTPQEWFKLKTAPEDLIQTQQPNANIEDINLNLESLSSNSDVIENATFAQNTTLPDQNDSVIDIPETRIVGEEGTQEIDTGRPLDQTNIDADGQIQLSTDFPVSSIFSGTRTQTPELEQLQREINAAPDQSLKEIAQTAKDFGTSVIEAFKQGAVDEQTQILKERAEQDPAFRNEIERIKQQLVEQGDDPGVIDTILDTITLGKLGDISREFLAPVEAGLTSAGQAVTGQEVTPEENLTRAQNIQQAHKELLQDKNFSSPMQKLIVEGAFFAALDKGAKTLGGKGLDGLKKISPGFANVINFLQRTEDVGVLNRVLQKGTQFGTEVVREALIFPLALPQQDQEIIDQILTGGAVSATTRLGFEGLRAISAPLFSAGLRAFNATVGSPDEAAVFAKLLRNAGISREEALQISETARKRGVHPLAVLDDEQRKVVIDVFSSPEVRQIVKKEAPRLLQEADNIVRVQSFVSELADPNVRTVEDINKQYNKSVQSRLKSEAELFGKEALENRQNEITQLIADSVSSDKITARRATAQLSDLIQNVEDIKIKSLPKGRISSSLEAGIDDLTQTVGAIEGNLSPIYGALDKRLEGALFDGAIRDLEKVLTQDKFKRSGLDVINRVNSQLGREPVDSIQGSIPNSFEFLTLMFQELGPSSGKRIKGGAIPRAKELRSSIANTLDAATQGVGLEATDPSKFSGFFTEFNSLYGQLASTAKRLQRKADVFDDINLRLSRDMLPTNLHQSLAGSASAAKNTRAAFKTKAEFNEFANRLKAIDKLNLKINSAEGLKASDIIKAGGLTDELQLALPFIGSNKNFITKILNSSDDKLVDAVVGAVGPEGRDLLAEGNNRFLLDKMTDFVNAASGDQLGQALSGKLSVLGLNTQQVNNISKTLSKAQRDAFETYSTKRISAANLQDILSTQVTPEKDIGTLSFLFRRFLETQGLIAADVATSSLFRSLNQKEQRAVVGALFDFSPTRTLDLFKKQGKLLDDVAEIVNKDLFEAAGQRMRTRQTALGPVTEILPKAYPITKEDVKMAIIGFRLADDRFSKELTKQQSKELEKEIDEMIKGLDDARRRSGSAQERPALEGISLTPQEQQALAGEEL